MAPVPATPAGRLPRGAVLRSVALLGLLAAGVVVAVLVDVPDVATVRGWLNRRGPVGWVLLLAAFSLAPLAPVPRTALSVLAGVLAGFWGGLALSLGSGVLAALAGFGLARWLGRETVTRLAGPRLARADALLTRRGAVAVLVGRLLPVTPFTLVSYASGLSGIPLGAYLLGSTVGMAPGSIAYVTLGATVGSAGEGGGLLLALVPLSVALVGLALARWWHVRRRATT
ncbi:TVP38/TMEM64 family protein [Modestobacter muralis]|uniref:TVP38/TMEM64 family membrane protein n=1 Tax=Modestobacter muralis TaxID=1608614 RepID=A0A6P0ET66_9ACTN|nr:TVP38/TMEM64 family protein [Modestobacter muralis]NEN50456.1 TVP38/TMEM64 family protein [Modestobacter muralis]